MTILLGSAAGISFAFYIHVLRNFARELRIEDCFRRKVRMTTFPGC